MMRVVSSPTGKTGYGSVYIVEVVPDEQVYVVVLAARTRLVCLHLWLIWVVVVLRHVNLPQSFSIVALEPLSWRYLTASLSHELT